MNYEQIKQGLTEKIEGKAKLLYKGNLNNYNVTTGSVCFEVTITVSYCEGCTGGTCDANGSEGCQAGVCYVDTSTFVLCYEIGDGGGGFNGGIGPPGEAIGSVGGNGNDGVDIIYNNPNASAVEDPKPMTPNVADTRIDGHNFENDNKTPCDQLKSFSKMESNNPKIPNLKNKIDEVKTYAADNFPHEVIYNFMKDFNGNYGTTNLTISETNNSAELKLNGYYYGGIHSHHPMLYPMFSWSDVYSLKKVYDRAAPYNRSEVTFLLAAKECLTCSNVVVYALKIDDFAALSQKINNDMIDPDNPNNNNLQEKIDYANAQFSEKFKVDMNVQQLEKLFLDNFAGAGISIYKANNDDYTDWGKLTLSGNPIAPVTNTPCN